MGLPDHQSDRHLNEPPRAAFSSLENNPSRTFRIYQRDIKYRSSMFDLSSAHQDNMVYNSVKLYENPSDKRFKRYVEKST